MREALTRTHYKELRAEFGPLDLLDLIKKRPALVEEWIAYSEDKRTLGGWYIFRDGEIGQIREHKPRLFFNSLEEAVAEYVVRELDFWAHLGDVS